MNELVAVRNKLSHNEAFTYDDAERALDSMRHLMEAIGAGSPAERLGKMRDTILRIRFTELQRNEECRKTQRLAEISVDTAGGLLPWREVVEPRQDVATGEFLQQARQGWPARWRLRQGLGPLASPTQPSALRRD